MLKENVHDQFSSSNARYISSNFSKLNQVWDELKQIDENIHSLYLWFAGHLQLNRLWKQM